MSRDALAATFNPAELVEASRRVLESPGRTGAPPAGFLATGREADAVRVSIAAFRDASEALLDERELAVLEYAREQLPNADGETLRRAVDRVRQQDERAVEEAVGRLTRDLCVAFTARDRDHLLRVTARERDRMLDLDDRAERRVVEAARALGSEGRRVMAVSQPRRRRRDGRPVDE
jgi:hypothetical protein